MDAVECNLNAMITKNKSLINNFNRNWRQPLNRKFENNRFRSFNQTLILTIKIFINLSQINIHYYPNFSYQ